MLNGEKFVEAADQANKLANNDKYSDRVKHWQAKVAEVDPENILNLHGGNLGALALVVGLNTSEEKADRVFDHVVQILKADYTTSFQNILEDLKEKSKKK